MRRYVLNFGNGEQGTLRQLDDGTFACPICGTPWPYPPYMPNDGELGEIYELSSPSIGDVCPGCGVEMGVDEGMASTTPVGAQARQWHELRLRWLDRMRWSEDALRQLRDNLEMTDDEIRDLQTHRGN